MVAIGALGLVAIGVGGARPPATMPPEGDGVGGGCAWARDPIIKPAITAVMATTALHSRIGILLASWVWIALHAC